MTIMHDDRDMKTSNGLQNPHIALFLYLFISRIASAESLNNQLIFLGSKPHIQSMKHYIITVNCISLHYNYIQFIRIRLYSYTI